MIMLLLLFCAAVTVAAYNVDSFTILPAVADRSSNRLLTSLRLKEGAWVSLADGVKKRVIQEGEGEVAHEGSEVEVDYVGTLQGESDWTVQDVVDCWLKNQQGLYHLCAMPLSKLVSTVGS
jgi:hypothetical protein